LDFDVIPQSAEEMNIDYSSAGKLLILSIICAVIWYVAITMAISLASPAVRTSSGIVAAEAMESLLHSKAGGAVIAPRRCLWYLDQLERLLYVSQSLFICNGKNGYVTSSIY